MNIPGEKHKICPVQLANLSLGKVYVKRVFQVK